jgi:hypothetical protein
MKQEIRRKNYSEVLTSNILNQNKENLENKPNNRINEEHSKENIFLESFSDIAKTTKNQIVDTINLNLEELSVLDVNQNLFSKNLMMSNNKMANKTMIKIITSKFHDLYLKLVNQIKSLKLENNNLKKKTTTTRNSLENKEEKSGNGYY